MADQDREENRIPENEGEEIIIEGPEDEKTAEDSAETEGTAATENTEDENTEDENTENENTEDKNIEGGNSEEENTEAEDTKAEDSETDTAEESDAEPEETAGDGKPEGSGKASDTEIRGRLEKDKLKKQIEDLTDKLKRSLAEFDNFRKRTEKEKSSMYDIGARDIVEKMLPVLDNFERGLAAAPADDKFAEGMQMIYKQLVTALTEAGVKPIEAAGQTFDPKLHNAVMHVEDENLGENVVAEEFQKGYLFKDHVVRHSMVKVAN